MRLTSLLLNLLCIAICLAGSARTRAAEDLAAFGRTLFFDTGLSEPPGQSCATCHDPQRAFSEIRNGPAGRALSIGADHRSLTDRNTPSLTYVATIPVFGRDQGHFRGGFFLDGRAPTLQAQVLEPLLNPLEMALPDQATLVSRVLGKAAYRETLSALFGGGVMSDHDALLRAIGSAIATFERSAELSRFDSKYDRYLAGEYVMTRAEAIGRELFFSDLINCVQCHVNEPGRISPRETFTDHRYHNIGVPTNKAARSANGLDPSHQDVGLAANPEVMIGGQQGKFRVPGLRNVAVTGPYMHNGVFRSLETAVAFYAQYTLRNRPSRINPETGAAWLPAEVPETVERDILSAGQPIDASRVQHLVAFLRTLTDQRYEALLD